MLLFTPGAPQRTRVRKKLHWQRQNEQDMLVVTQFNQNILDKRGFIDALLFSEKHQISIFFITKA